MAASSPIVQIKDGKLRGTEREIHNGVRILAFQGIPYAKPPLGELRFKAPQPIDPWEGVKDADKDGSCCYHRDMLSNQHKGSEDCLFLNVFTKSVSPQKPKPVMVFIHGGGFVGGSNNIDECSPDFLLMEDVVLVTINYRLGILGFLSLNDPTLDVPGNAGMKDQVFALKWVQKNIRSFGGDPDNVTIFGESAGAASVHYLVLSPTAKGLFHKAILQSGCVLNPWANGSRGITTALKAIGKNFRDEKQCLDNLSKLPVEELYELEELLLKKRGVILRFFAPVVEQPNPTAFITEDPYEMLKTGKYNKVPLMMGYNDKEGVIFEIEQCKFLIGTTKGGKAELEHMLLSSLELDKGCTLIENLKKKIEDLYFKVDDMDSRVNFTTDMYFLGGLRYSAELHAATSSEPLYFYRFSADTDLHLVRSMSGVIYEGASHADELGYLFKYPSVKIEKGSAEDTMMTMMVKLWTNFAKASNPTPPNSDVGVTWKPVESGALQCMDIGNSLTLMNSPPETERLAFWKYFDQVFFDAGHRYSFRLK